MFPLSGFGSDDFVDASDSSFDDLLFGMSSNDGVNNNFDDPDLFDGMINPAMLTSTAPYASVSPWSTPQSVRTTRVTIEAEVPTHPMDGTSERLVRRLNQALREALESGVMTDSQVLGTTTSYLDAFKHGRSF